MDYQELDLGGDIREFRVVSRISRLVWPDVLAVFLCILCLAHGVNTHLCVFVLVLVVIHLYFVTQSVQRESLLLLRGLGIQLQTTYLSGKEVRTFIDREKIVDIIVNEGFSGCRVIYYLAIVVKEESKLYVVFSHMCPPYQTLMQVYHASREVLCL